MRLRVDVAVLGAGPGGCAAAIVLAGGGARVLVCDRAVFPRDKVCGDAVLPDALAMLARLGVSSPAALGHPVRGLRYRTVRGREIHVPLAAAVVRRRDLDARLLDAAVNAGAKPLLGAEVSGAVRSGDGTASVLLATRTGTVEVAADAYVLATGAAPRPREALALSGGCRSAVAVRGYAELRGPLDDELLLSLREELPGGYAWAFPAAAGAWNVGCGVFEGRGRGGLLRKAASGFLMANGGRCWHELPKGAPLNSSYPHMRVARGNVLAVGDAAGLSRPMTGEGVGPALRSGILAGECLVHRLGVGGVEGYRMQLRRRFSRDHRAWRLGERLISMPALLEPLVCSACESPAIRQRIAGVFAGTVPAATLLSPLGLLRVFLGR